LNAGDSITSTQTIYVFSAGTGSCPDVENSFEVTINSTPLADAPADVESCDSYELPALTNGTYYAGPGGTGSVLNAGDSITSTQTIYVFTAGTGSCPDVENSFEVTINALPSAPVTTDLEYCIGDTPEAISSAITASGTLIWYSDAAATTQIPEPTIDTNSPGSITYFVSQTDENTCESLVSPITITINDIPTIAIVSDPVCSADLLTYSLDINVSTGSVVTSSEGVVSNNGSDNWTISNIPSGTNITLTVVNSNSCVAQLNVNAPNCSCPVVDAPVSLGDVAYCAGEQIPVLEATVNANETVNWYDSPSGGNLLLASSSTYTPVTSGIFYAEAVNTINNCNSATRTAITVTENQLDDASFMFDESTYCIDSENPIPVITGLAGGVFSSTAGLAIDSSTGEIDMSNSLPGSYMVTYTTNGICPNSFDVEVLINELPTINPLEDISQCNNGNFVLTQSTSIGEGSWSLISSTGSNPILEDNSGVLSVSDLQPGTSAVLRYTIRNGQCEVFDDVTITNEICSIVVVKTQISGPNPVRTAGEVLGYEIELINPGTISLTDVVMTDILPNSEALVLEFISGDEDTDNELDTNERWLYNAQYTVSQSDIDAGMDIINTASVVTSEVPGPTVDTAVTEVNAISNLTVTKLVTTAGSQVGDVLTYDIVVTNTGTVTLSDIEILDDNADAGSMEGSPIATLLPNESATVTVEQTITQADMDAGYIENSATAIGDSPSGTDDVVDISDAGSETTETPNGDGSTDGDATNDPTVTLLQEFPGIEVKKIAEYRDNGDAIDNVGDVVDYTIQVTNTGNVTLQNINVEDVMLNFNGDAINLDAPGVLFVSADNNSPEGILQVGETAFYSASYSITQVDINSGGISNSVFVEANTLQGTVASDTSDDGNDDDGNTEDDPTEISFEFSSSISLVKTTLPLQDDNGDGIAGGVNDIIRYVFTVENTGNVTLSNINILDPLPGVVVIGGAIEQLDPGDIDSTTITAEYNITQEDIDTGFVTNSAIVRAESPLGDIVADFSDDPNDTTDLDLDANGDPDDSTVTQVTSLLDIEVLKSVNISEPVVGDEVIFTIEVANLGNVNASNVVISEVIPSGYEFIEAISTTGVYSEVSGDWVIPELGLGQAHILEITVEVLGIGDYVNVAFLESVAPFDDINPNNDSSEAEVIPVCLTIYNEFSPNNDGVNDEFVIDCLERFPNNRVEIYNRWGNLVFSQNGYNNDWTGTSNTNTVVNRGDDLPVGTYYYIIDLKDGSEPRMGWLYINR
jgi:gliding motility-associated-like protein/uncharacterized repeat protein (TIGR01451 family)